MTLFEKYGGPSFWTDVLNNFYLKVAVSPRLSHHFTSKNISHISNMILAIIESTFENHSDEDFDRVRYVHKYLSICNADMDEWVRLYDLTLVESRVEENDRKKLREMMERYRPYLVTNLS